jgi:predicted esterase
LAGIPIYIGCDEQDFHIPIDRVERTAQALSALGVQVELKIYKALGHTVHPDGIEFLERSLGGSAKLT